VYAVLDGGQAVDVAVVLGGQDLYLALEGDGLAGLCARGDHEVGRGWRGRRRPAEVLCRSDRAGGPMRYLCFFDDATRWLGLQKCFYQILVDVVQQMDGQRQLFWYRFDSLQRSTAVNPARRVLVRCRATS
jgi:hypothetical protein